MNITRWLNESFGKNDYALVTGSTSGIGRAYAEALAAQGCNLICLSNEEAALQQQQNDLEKQHLIDVKTINLDLGEVDSTLECSQKLPQVPIKILVNNAGIGIKGRFEMNEAVEYANLIKINAIAPVILLRAVLPSMQSLSHGLIINVSSINSLLPIPNNQVYTASKAFFSNLSSAVAFENRKENIKFQLVLPGTTKTPFHDKQGANPKRMTMMPEDVVSVSLANVNRQICIPNKADRVLARLVPWLPLDLKMGLASYILKKRLGI